MDKQLGNNLRETQEVLINLIGFDYEVFTSTACFNQGEADQFSKLTPSEGKQVVMKILQLGKFEEYEKFCREKVTELSTEYNTLLKEIEITQSLTETIEDTKPILDRLEVVEKLLVTLHDGIEKAKNEVQYELKLRELTRSLEKFSTMDKCPTCLQNIHEEHKRMIIKKFNDAIEANKKMIGGISPSTYIDNQNEAIRKLTYEESALRSKLDEVVRKAERQKGFTTKKEELTKKQDQVKVDIETYKKLSEAFGRNGIPSYIIENIVPEIEYIVNNLMGLLGVEFSVRIDLQKELKSGGTSDTLNINIIAGKAIRPYTNYSGGEKFIIDLALRVALSVILLRRKGCNNSTLIVDEGFGSLDDVNREKVIKLIGIVKEKYGFKKIIVITHMEDIKDNLPNKILIEKKNDCSIVSYNINKET